MRQKEDVRAHIDIILHTGRPKVALVYVGVLVDPQQAMQNFSLNQPRDPKVAMPTSNTWSSACNSACARRHHWHMDDLKEEVRTATTMLNVLAQIAGVDTD